MRLSEGICPACEEPLARGREDGICNCCGWTWRLRDGVIECRNGGDWGPDVDGPQGCHEGEGQIVFAGGAVFEPNRIHVFHLPSRSHQPSSTERGQA